MNKIGREDLSKNLELNGYRVDLFALKRDLLIWGNMHFRPFPWRLNNNPYNILIAEVMLHRTQASQVLPIYIQFIKKYPDPATLAKATIKELRDKLFPLGLRWRVDMMHAMSQILQDRFNGQIPDRKEDLLSLPGISDYIASAVLCFSWDRPEAIIDTNTVRIAGRLFGIEIKESSRRSRLFKDLIKDMVDKNNPRRFNYALLDLAALICTKRYPECQNCPARIFCDFGTKAVIR